jgi:ribosome-binding factor A
MKHRLLRVRELLKRELGEVLHRDFEFRDALVTVNDVDVTPDLKQAHAYLGIIAKHENASAAILDELNAKHGAIQKKISARVVLRYTPQIHFKEDRSVERGVRLVELMQEIERTASPPVDGADAGPGGGRP